MTDRGDIRVAYEGCNNRWTFNPAVLTKINAYAIGDMVRVITDPVKVRDYQKGHGEWIEVMKSVSKVVTNFISKVILSCKTDRFIHFKSKYDI